jgi:hypothetical protein
MRSVAMVLLTAVTVGVVAAIGTAAVAVAMIPGESAGEVQPVSAIAAPTQDASVGAALTAVEGTPAEASAPQVITLDSAPAAKTSDDAGSGTGTSEHAANVPEETPAAPTAGAANPGNGNPTPPAKPGNPGPKPGNGNSGPGDAQAGRNGNSGPGSSDKAAKDAEKAAREAQKAAEKAAKEQEKADKDAQKAADKAAKDAEKDK